MTMINPIRNRIPGCDRHPVDRRRAVDRTTALMATDALSGLTFEALCDVIEAHIEARPDIDHARLMGLGNRLCRLADAAERADAANRAVLKKEN